MIAKTNAMTIPFCPPSAPPIRRKRALRPPRSAAVLMPLMILVSSSKPRGALAPSEPPPLCCDVRSCPRVHAARRRIPAQRESFLSIIGDVPQGCMKKLFILLAIVLASRGLSAQTPPTPQPFPGAGTPTQTTSPGRTGNGAEPAAPGRSAQPPATQPPPTAKPPVAQPAAASPAAPGLPA